MLEIWPVWEGYAGMVAYFLVVAILLVVVMRRGRSLVAKVMVGATAAFSAFIGLMYLAIMIVGTF